MTRDAAGLIHAADGAVEELLGWTPDDLVGRPSTDFIHPADQPAAIAAWFEMLAAPGAIRSWRGRYRCADGSWALIEASNCNELDDPRRGVVSTTIRRLSGEAADLEEVLRSREQLLSRLADALPVGLVQLDADRQVTFTNDQLHAILGTPAAATASGQFVAVAQADRPALEGALAAVLSGGSPADTELRLDPSDHAGRGERICSLALRGLTDSAGTVTGAIGCLSDVTDSVVLRRELHARATTDQLTGARNRAATIDVLGEALGRPGPGTAVVFLDVDGLKPLNDRYGHKSGDLLLQVVARKLMAAARAGDVVGRLGGDEFLVVCPGVAGPGLATAIAHRFEEAVNTMVTLAGKRVALRASVGMAWGRQGADADQLIARADDAMYLVKQRRSDSTRPRLLTGT